MLTRVLCVFRNPYRYGLQPPLSFETSEGGIETAKYAKYAKAEEEWLLVAKLAEAGTSIFHLPILSIRG